MSTFFISSFLHVIILNVPYCVNSSKRHDIRGKGGSALEVTQSYLGVTLELPWSYLRVTLEVE